MGGDKPQRGRAGKVKNPAIWEKLQAFVFDANTGTQPYSVKLAEAEGWDATFAERVIEEYRRFLYLAQIADHEVTPSVAVDQAWHTHLTFTRSYWDDLCDGVLDGPFHHDPCKGKEDMPRYNEQYDRTLALYFTEFGHVPPSDIWPRSEEVAPPQVDPLQKWFATKGIVIGLCVGLPVLVALMIFGVTVWTVFPLVICGALIFAGILSFPGDKTRKGKDSTGGGAFVGGCASGAKKGGGADGSSGDGGSAGCGGGGCGGGGGG